MCVLSDEHWENERVSTTTGLKFKGAGSGVKEFLSQRASVKEISGISFTTGHREGKFRDFFHTRRRV